MLRFALSASQRHKLWSRNHHIAIGAAVSLTALAEYAREKSVDKKNNLAQQERQESNDETLRPHDEHSSSLGIDLLQNLHSATQNYSIMLGNILKSTNKTTSCLFDGPAPYALPGALPISRRRTVLQLQDASTRHYSIRDKYDVKWKQPLGEGGFGAVYMARNRETNEMVAVKKIPKTLTDDVSFQREMNALLHIREQGGHPHICGLQENFEEGDHYYLVLDLISGGEMFDHLCSHGAYSEADAARLVREVASALAFIHGTGCVHGDLKPENLMLSTENPSDAVIKVVDFGISQIIDKNSKFFDRHISSVPANTPGYSPPEVVDRRRRSKGLTPSADIWAIGVIIYIMLAGVHPFDLSGTSTDKEINDLVLSGKGAPLRGSPLTEHLSESAIDLIEKLIHQDPKKRLTALQMLNHPWVRGETALTGKIKDSDQRLSTYRKYKSRLEAKVFESMVQWTDDPDATNDAATKQKSLIERSFQMLDPEKRGYITKKKLQEFSSSGGSLDDDEDSQLSLSGFSDLISENMKNRYFPAGQVVYKEGERGDKMYFINSGRVEVSTKAGFRTISQQGDFFGEGALLHSNARRSATIKTLTPVHAIEIGREYFSKYIAGGEDLQLSLLEKDKVRKRERAKTIFDLQQNIKVGRASNGEYLFKVGENGNDLFVLKDGTVDVIVDGHTVFTSEKGGMIGEHSVIFNRPRNTSAKCTSNACIFQVLPTKEVDKLMKAHPAVKDTIRDTCFRREFQKAIVYKTKKCFPKEEHELLEVFNAADEDNTGEVGLKNLRDILLEYDSTFTDKEVKDILGSLDIDNSGEVSFKEFKQIFLDRHNTKQHS